MEGYRSAWKYWLSNQKMKKTLNENTLTFIDNYSNFVTLNKESITDNGLNINDIINGKVTYDIEELAPTFTWHKDYNTDTKNNDYLHWDEPTTKTYMQLAFDTAGV